MYKKLNTDDIFNAVDGNRQAAIMSTPKTITVDTSPISQNGNATDAEKIRAMGDRLSEIWKD